MSLDELNDMQRYLVEEEAEKLDEGEITRREFVRRITLLLGGAVAAGPILVAYGCGDVVATATPTAATATTAPPPATAVPATATTAAAPPSATTAAAPSATSGAQTTPPAPPAPTPVGGFVSPFHVDADDPAISGAMVEFPGTGGAKLMGYLATPAGATGKLPAVLVIHENRGLTEHIKDVVRRVAKAGYVGLGVDLLSRAGGTAGLADDAARTAALGQSPPEQLVGDLSSGLDFLKTHAMVAPERLGVTGFCFGGGMTWRLATQRPDLKAAVPYYGPNPPLTDVPKIKAAVLGIYGGNDARITGQAPQLEEALKAAGIKYEFKIYDGADHAFNNDTGTRYNAAAAEDAWQRTLDWFATHLKS